jgi:hypothetical protein
MKQVTITAYLPDMLRDYLDRVIKPHEIPSQDEIKAFLHDSSFLDDARKDIVAGYLTRQVINIVIDQKETLTVLDSLGPWAVDAQQNTYLEDYYAYQFVDTLPEIVERAQALVAVLVKNQPRKEIIVILREAFRSYIHGLYVACVCICRCILEQLLEESLKGSKSKLVSIGFYKRLDGRRKSQFQVLIDMARHEKILDERGSDIARRIIERGNEAAHEGRSSERIALRALLDVQVLLRDYFIKT